MNPNVTICLSRASGDRPHLLILRPSDQDAHFNSSFLPE